MHPADVNRDPISTDFEIPKEAIEKSRPSTDVLKELLEAKDILTNRSPSVEAKCIRCGRIDALVPYGVLYLGQNGAMCTACIVTTKKEADK